MHFALASVTQETKLLFLNKQKKMEDGRLRMHSVHNADLNERLN